MGKQYNISELIDGYTDSEFLIEGESGADTEAVLKGVMAKVKPKKRLRLGVKLLMAAALAATVTITAATAAASSPVRVYKRLNGGTLTIGQKDHPYVSDGYGSSNDNIYVEEDGRIYFTVDGQHLDITDSIDFETPYYYRSDVTDNWGEVHERWVAVGGKPGYIGWMEIIFDVDGYGHKDISGFSGIWDYWQYYIDGEIVTFLSPEGTDFYIDKYPYRYIEFDWVKKAYERFKGPYSQEHYDAEKSWKYPRDWEGELLDDNIPFPEDLTQFE